MANQLPPDIAAALAAKAGLPAPAVEAPLVPNAPLAADAALAPNAPLDPAAVAQQAMPSLEPYSAPAPIAPTALFDAPAPPPGATLADTVQIPPGETIASPDTKFTHPAAAPISPEFEQAQAAEALAREEEAQAQAQFETQEADKISKQERRAAVRQIAAKDAIETAVKAYEDEKAQQAANQAAQTEELQKAGQERGARTLADIMQNGSWGQQLGAALSIMAGGVAQGLLKLQSNPALDVINKMVEQEGERRKLDLQAKKELREAALAQSKFKLDELAQRVTSETAKANIAKIKADIELEHAKLQGASAQDAALKAAVQQGRNGELNDVVGLPAELRDAAVRLPNGKYAVAKNKHAAEKLDEFNSSVEPALASIDRILELERSYKLTDKLKGVAGFSEKRKQIEGEIVKLIGNLRLPYTGPGILTDKEYERLKTTIGNPGSTFSLPSHEVAKLQTTQAALAADRRSAYHRAGINLPETRRERLEESMVRQGMGRAEVKEALRRKFGN